MAEKLKINVVIAGRTYPLSVNNTNEEEGMRKAANAINYKSTPGYYTQRK